jgi:phenylpyruvate tautomerase PptA (4-oxalocrotonate tautomerase family)
VPLVTVDLLQGRSHEELDTILDCVHEAMVAELDVPQRDRFQILREHTPRTLRFDPSYLEIERGAGFVLVGITLAAGRATTAKQAFYRRLADLLAERVGLRTEDLAVTLVENAREDWSFGRGAASYLELPPEAWR